MDQTSSSLLLRVKNQDADARVRLVQWIGPFILRWCRQFSLQSADQEEVTQQVLLNVWQHLDSFRKVNPKDSFRGWVYAITRNCVRDFKTRRQETPFRLPEQWESPSDTSEDEELSQRALQLILDDALSEFQTDVGFQAFYQTAVNNRVASEVADDLGLSHASVRQHKSRWRKRLRDQLREQFGELL